MSSRGDGAHVLRNVADKELQSGCGGGFGVLGGGFVDGAIAAALEGEVQTVEGVVDG